jgi:hypothetical protein
LFTGEPDPIASTYSKKKGCDRQLTLEDGTCLSSCARSFVRLDRPRLVEHRPHGDLSWIEDSRACLPITPGARLGSYWAGPLSVAVRTSHPLSACYDRCESDITVHYV